MTVYEVRYELMGDVYVTYYCPSHHAQRSIGGVGQPSMLIRGPIKVAEAQCVNCVTANRLREVQVK